MRRNSTPVRIDQDMSDLLNEISKKNDISIRQASKELASMSRLSIKGKKSIREITF